MAGEKKQKQDRLLLLLILLLALLVRVWQFGQVPGDINQDEAFAGYEAWSLLTTGRDTAGYPFPVYLTAWGSGMNVLESLLMLPFIALFGLEVWVIRLPQLIVGLCSVGVLYPTAKRLMGRRAALFAAFLLAVCPWHVLLSRWGLESNLAPGFLLFGFCCFLRGLEDSRFFLLSALFYGLSLYAYAAIWPVVPLMGLLQLLYCARTGRMRLDKWLLLALCLLLALALPLLLFLAVNFGWMEELRTPFFSIPRLLAMRSGEFSLRNIPENLLNLLDILLRQSDGLNWNSAGVFGLLYRPTLLLALAGIIAGTARVFRALPRREYRPEALLLIQLLGGALLGALLYANVNRVNILFIPLVLLAALGLEALCQRFSEKLLPVAAALYAAFFLCFTAWYFTDYRQDVQLSFSYGLRAAVEATRERGGEVYVGENIIYSELLFLDRVPPEEFRETVRYKNYPAAFLNPASFGRWRFVWGAEPDPDATYLLSPWDDPGPFLGAGYTLETYGYYTLAWQP